MEQMECMCQQCGISFYLPADMVSLEEDNGAGVRLLNSLVVCEHCGGRLALIGRAGDEPYYRLG